MNYLDTPQESPVARRPMHLLTVMLVGLACIVARLWYLQVARGDELLLASERNRSKLVRRMPPRGQILDSKGRLVAGNRARMVVTVVPDEVRKSPESLITLAALLGTTVDDLAGTITQNRVSAVDPVRVAEDVDMATVTAIEEHRSEMPGVDVGPEPVRFYPDGPLLGHILGQLGQVSREEIEKRKSSLYRPGDYSGKLGVERFYDDLLRGTDGGTNLEVDARGRPRRVLEERRPLPGASITLTIDRDLQRVAYEGLAEFARDGKPGAAVALDPRTGAVLALASVPSYDPNLFVRKVTSKDWNALNQDPRKPLINRAVGSAYAPGSTFKIVSASGGLETGATDRHTSDFCTGSIKLGRWTKRCHKHSGHGTVYLQSAMAKSCDVYFYHMGQRMGPDRLADFAHRFGLGKKTGIDLPGVELSGTVPSPEWKQKRFHEPWVGGDTVDYAIGQSMLTCTPLQMCNVTAAAANGGTLWRPQLVREILGEDAAGRDVVVQKLKPEKLGTTALSASTSGLIVRSLQSVMEPGGTASALAIPGIKMAGKTGTAQMRYRGQMVNNSWFVAFAPLENPVIAVCVFVERGGHGGDAAGPIARKMIAHHLGVQLNPPSPVTPAAD